MNISHKIMSINNIKECWYYLDKNGKEIYHRGDDRPAIIYRDGSIKYMYHGKTHRENGASFIKTDGFKSWSYNGEFLGNNIEVNSIFFDNYEVYSDETFEIWKKYKVFK